MLQRIVSTPAPARYCSSDSGWRVFASEGRSEISLRRRIGCRGVGKHLGFLPLIFGAQMPVDWPIGLPERELLP